MISKYTVTQRPPIHGSFPTEMRCWLVKISVPIDGKNRSMISYEHIHIGDGITWSFMYVISILQWSHLKSKKGITQCAASVVPMRNLLEWPSRWSCNWTPRWKLSRTINPQICLDNIHVTVSTTDGVNKVKNRSLCIQDTVVPMKEVTWASVSCVPQPYIAIKRIRHQCGSEQKLDWHRRRSIVTKTCLSLKAVNADPSQSLFTFHNNDKKAHCSGNILRDAFW